MKNYRNLKSNSKRLAILLLSLTIFACAHVPPVDKVEKTVSMKVWISPDYEQHSDFNQYVEVPVVKQETITNSNTETSQ